MIKQKDLGHSTFFSDGKKIDYLMFYGGQYINLVKSGCSTKKLCIIVSAAT